MKVWIVFWEYEYGLSRDFKGAFSSKEEVEKYVKNFSKKETYKFNDHIEFFYSDDEGEGYSIIETEVK